MTELELSPVGCPQRYDPLLLPTEETHFFQMVFNFLLDYPNTWTYFANCVREMRGVTNQDDCVWVLIAMFKYRWSFTQPCPNLWGGQKKLLEEQKNELLLAMSLVRQQDWLKEEPVLPARSRGVEPEVNCIDGSSSRPHLPFGGQVSENGE